MKLLVKQMVRPTHSLLDFVSRVWRKLDSSTVVDQDAKVEGSLKVEHSKTVTKTAVELNLLHDKYRTVCSTTVTRL
jgi:hypothetical protein